MDEREMEECIRSCAAGAVPLLIRGWIKGALSRTEPDGSISYCVLGAFNEKLFLAKGRRDAEYARLQDEFRRRFVRLTGFGVVSIYNDRPERTLDEVVDIMSRIARGEGVGEEETVTE